MSDAKFTPGPWFVDGDDHFATVLAPDGWVIAKTDHLHAGDDPGNCGVHLANMQLIAAAPDLLAACRLTLDDSHPLLVYAAGVMRAAVAKATINESPPMPDVDAAEARRLLRAGMYYTPPDLLRPETPMDPATVPAPTMPRDLSAAVLHRLLLAADYLADADAGLDQHYADAGRPGEYRTGEYPRGIEDTWHRIAELVKAAKHLAAEFRRYQPAAATDPAPAPRAM